MESKATIVEPRTPECDKLLAVRDKSQLLGEFIEWLSENDMSICDKSLDVVCEPLNHDIEKLLARFFNIDLAKVEVERREVLAYCRLVNEEKSIRQELLLDDKG